MQDLELKSAVHDVLKEHFPRVLWIGSIRSKVSQRLGRDVEAIAHVLIELRNEGKVEFQVGGEWKYISPR